MLTKEVKVLQNTFFDTKLHNLQSMIFLWYLKISSILKSLIRFFIQSQAYHFFGNAHHSSTAIFMNYSKQHKNGLNLGVIEPAEAMLGDELLSLMRLYCLYSLLTLTIIAREFLELPVWQQTFHVLN